MIYYPLSVLILGETREKLVILTPADLPRFRTLLDGSRGSGFGRQYFLWRDPVTPLVREAVGQKAGATVFGYWVDDPARYGVAEIDAVGQVLRIEEKPAAPRSHYAARMRNNPQGDHLYRLARDAARL
jgi:glucose-1-phosphate thymidylyltransferase